MRDIFLRDEGQSLTVGGEVALLTKGDHLLRDRLDFLRTAEGRLELAVLQQIGGQLTEHRLALIARSAELTGSKHSYFLLLKGKDSGSVGPIP